jgi:hypothetical protein
MQKHECKIQKEDGGWRVERSEQMRIIFALSPSLRLSTSY